MVVNEIYLAAKNFLKKPPISEQIINKKSNVLICTSLKFWKRRKGNHQRIYNVVKLLDTNNFKVTIFYIGWISQLRIVRLRKEFVNVDFVVGGDLLSKIIIDLKLLIKEIIGKSICCEIKKVKIAIIKNINKEVSFFKPDINCKKASYNLKKYLKHNKCDSIIVEYLKYSGLLISSNEIIKNRKIKTIVDTHDVMNERYGDPCKEKVREQEIELLKKYDVIVAINYRDKYIFKEMLPNSTVITLLHTILDITYLPFKDKRTINIVFVAGSADVNKDSIEWFIKNIWNSLIKYNKDLFLLIYGDICNKIENIFLKNSKNIILKGVFDELKPVYSNADIVINFPFFGSGLKIKNVEALCYGKPLITNSIGSQGLEDGINVAFYEANTREEVREKICILIDDKSKRKEIGVNAFKYASGKFNTEVVTKEFYDELKK